jgi:hypothetical protein
MARGAITPIIRLHRFADRPEQVPSSRQKSSKNYKENKKLPAINRFFIE